MSTKIPQPVPKSVPSFNVDDVESWKSYLDDNGYVVIKNIVNDFDQKFESFVDLAWDYLESLGKGIDRNDTSTWGNDRWPTGSKGILLAGQSELMWTLRSEPQILEIFRKLWETESLAVSFDGFSIFRPPEVNIEWQTTTVPWYHTDQNGSKSERRGRQCIQGQFASMKASEIDGGLVVVPESHKYFDEMFDTFPSLGQEYPDGDFVSLYKPEAESIWSDFITTKGLSPVKLCHDENCFILWDSRTIHCNAPALVDINNLKKDCTKFLIRRLTTFICMIPMSLLTEDDKKRRRRFFLDGRTTTHWPKDCVGHPNKSSDVESNLPVLNEIQKALIPI